MVGRLGSCKVKGWVDRGYEERVELLAGLVNMEQRMGMEWVMWKKKVDRERKGNDYSAITQEVSCFGKMFYDQFSEKR